MLLREREPQPLHEADHVRPGDEPNVGQPVIGSRETEARQEHSTTAAVPAQAGSCDFTLIERVVEADGTTLLFGLPGVRVERVERGADGTRVVHAVTASETAAACPSCGGVLHGGEGSGEHLAARHSLR